MTQNSDTYESAMHRCLSSLLLDALRKGHTVEIDMPEGGGYRFVIDDMPLTERGWGDWERFTVPMEGIQEHLTDDAEELVKEVYAEDVE